MPVSLRVVGLTALLASLPATARAQASAGSSSPETAELRERLADKLAAPFLCRNRWHTDLDAARREAARSGKLIFAHHTRSFVPCGTSIRCEREVLSTPDFDEFAEDVVLYSHVTAHLDAEHDRRLFAHAGSGWPHHAILDASGRVLGRHPSHLDKSVAAFVGMLGRAREYLEVEVQAEAERAAVARRQLEAGLACGALDLTTARRLAAAARPVPAETAAAWERRLTDLEIEALLARHDRFDDSQHAVLGEAMYRLWRMGKRPERRNTSRDFWGGILLYLETRDAPDLDLYAEGLAELERRFGESRGYRRFLAARRGELARLRAQAALQRPRADGA